MSIALRGTESAAGTQPLTLPALDRAKDAAATGNGPDFGKVLTGALADASAAEKAADSASARFAAGDPKVGIHEVIIGAEKASISVRYAVTLKNKVLEAYRELMNTPL